jgi:hypothetical protein
LTAGEQDQCILSAAGSLLRVQGKADRSHGRFGWVGSRRQDLRDFSAAALRVRGRNQSKLFPAGNSIKASSALLWTCLMVARSFGQLTIYGCRIEARGTKLCTSLMFRGQHIGQAIANRIAFPVRPPAATATRAPLTTKGSPLPRSTGLSAWRRPYAMTCDNHEWRQLRSLLQRLYNKRTAGGSDGCCGNSWPQQDGQLVARPMQFLCNPIATPWSRPKRIHRSRTCSRHRPRLDRNTDLALN